MKKYSLDQVAFASALKVYSPTMFYYIDEAITQKNNVNYADELPRYTLLDVSINQDTQLLTFFFVGGTTKHIDLSVYDIRQSNSVPCEFYFSNRNTHDDYFVIIFKC